MSCNFCGNKNFTKKYVDYIYRNSESMMLVKNVPCEECDYCGERYFEATILKEIETNYIKIKNNQKSPKFKIEVPVEEYAFV